MTIKQAFEYVLIELNKVKAPSLLLTDFVYYWNKATSGWVNQEYTTYNLAQQHSDNLSSLTRSRIYTNSDLVSVQSKYNNSIIHRGTYEVYLPQDYLHLLGCVIEFSSKELDRCGEPIDNIYHEARRLTEDLYAGIVRNYYFKPSVKNPYFYIHLIDPLNTPLINPETGDRNTSPSPDGYRMEIRIGKDVGKYKIENVFVDYLRVPKYVDLTQDQLDEIIDTSQKLEFSDYVCQEIVNRCVSLILEHQSNPRLQSNLAVSQTITPLQTS